MGAIRPMTRALFRVLTKRDFDNGAVRNEIDEALRQREEQAAALTAARREADDLRARVAVLAAAVEAIREAAQLPEVVEESTDCPDCGAMVDWNGCEPDIGDCIACCTCVLTRLDKVRELVAAIPTDRAAGERWRAMERFVATMSELSRHGHASAHGIWFDLSEALDQLDQ